MTSDRAWILLPSGRRLDLLAPDPWAWTDDDLATGLSRTCRWGGYSAWDLPLSVAQHSLTVMALCRAAPGPSLTDPEALRELLHDAVEALMGDWDPLTPLKPHLGDAFARLVGRLPAAIDTRYALPPWTDESHARHKHADRLAAASEVHHVVGWSLRAMRDDLGITLSPVAPDPLRRARRSAWERWPPKIAAQRFLAEPRPADADVQQAVQLQGQPAHRGGAPARIEAMIAEARHNDMPIDPDGLRASARVYAAYQRMLRDANAADFGDLLLWPTRATQLNPAYRARWAGHFDCVLADEYQDVNQAQL